MFTLTFGVSFDTQNILQDSFWNLKRAFGMVFPVAVVSEEERNEQLVSAFAAPAWEAETKEEFGENTVSYISHVLADFSSEADNAVFPFKFIQAVLDRSRRSGQETDRVMGLDPAHEGPDLTCWAGIFGNRGEILDVEGKTTDSINSAEKTYRMTQEHGIIRIGIDNGGDSGVLTWITSFGRTESQVYCRIETPQNEDGNGGSKGGSQRGDASGALPTGCRRSEFLTRTARGTGSPAFS